MKAFWQILYLLIIYSMFHSVEFVVWAGYTGWRWRDGNAWTPDDIVDWDQFDDRGNLSGGG
jgi:hypothetical protein